MHLKTDNPNGEKKKKETAKGKNGINFLKTSPWQVRYSADRWQLDFPHLTPFFHIKKKIILSLVEVLFDLLVGGLLIYELNFTDTNFLTSGTNTI